MRLLAGLVAGFDWETVLVGDDSLDEPAHGPGGRAPDAHGSHGGGRGRTLPTAAPCAGWRVARRGLDLEGGQRQVKSAILLAGLSAEGTTTVREAITTRTHTEEMLTEAGADLTVEPWGEGRVVRVRASSLHPVDRTVPGDPSSSAFFAGRGMRGPGQRR